MPQFLARACLKLGVFSRILPQFRNSASRPSIITDLNSKTSPNATFLRDNLVIEISLATTIIFSSISDVVGTMLILVIPQAAQYYASGHNNKIPNRTSRLSVNAYLVEVVAQNYHCCVLELFRMSLSTSTPVRVIFKKQYRRIKLERYWYTWENSHFYGRFESSVVNLRSSRALSAFRFHCPWMVSTCVKGLPNSPCLFCQPFFYAPPDLPKNIHTLKIYHLFQRLPWDIEWQTNSHSSSFSSAYGISKLKRLVITKCSRSIWFRVYNSIPFYSPWKDQQVMTFSWQMW